MGLVGRKGLHDLGNITSEMEEKNIFSHLQGLSQNYFTQKVLKLRQKWIRKKKKKQRKMYLIASMHFQGYNSHFLAEEG